MPERTPPRKRAITWLAPLVFSFLPGCLIPYGFPTVSIVPAEVVGEEAAPVYAFRVDSTRKWADIGGQDDCTLTPVPVQASGWTPPQARISATYGYYVLGIALNYPVFTSHSVALRLYRPGYELVEIDSWEVPGEIDWRKAADLEAEEKTLDRLFIIGDKHKFEPPFIHRYLMAGSESIPHRQALLFGASEYERLAAGPLAPAANPEETRNRLLRKAAELRELAAH